VQIERRGGGSLPLAAKNIHLMKSSVIFPMDAVLGQY
jgi:hypothetical protein